VEGLICTGILALACVLGLVIYLIREARLREAELRYRESLRLLRQQPTDPDVREEVLRLGRVYSNLARDSKGRTLFDEVAIRNDIDAACAGAVRDEGSRQRRPVEESDSDHDVASPPAAIPIAAVPIPIHNIACPHCRGVLAVTPAHFGKTLGCPHCKKSFLLPGSSPA
jgi:hypothetical protein